MRTFKTDFLVYSFCGPVQSSLEVSKFGQNSERSMPIGLRLTDAKQRVIDLILSVVVGRKKKKLEKSVSEGASDSY